MDMNSGRLFKYGPIAAAIALAVVVALFPPISLVSGDDAAERPAGKPTGDLAVRGTVWVNGASASTFSTVVSGSRLVTEPRSSAVVGLKSLGRIYMDADTQLLVNFDDAGVHIELLRGSIRVQKTAATVMEVLTRTCNRVEVVEGEVLALTPDSKSKEQEFREDLDPGELQEFRAETDLLSKAKTDRVDYRISIIECGVAAAPVIIKPILPLVLPAALGGAAAGTIPTLVSGNPVSPSRP